MTLFTKKCHPTSRHTWRKYLKECTGSTGVQNELPNKYVLHSCEKVVRSLCIIWLVLLTTSGG